MRQAATAAKCPSEVLAERRVRYRDLRLGNAAFIDTRTPGSAEAVTGMDEKVAWTVADITTHSYPDWLKAGSTGRNDESCRRRND